MKKIVLITIMFSLVTSSSYAANLGVREIELGMDKAQVIELLNKHKGVRCYENFCQENAWVIRPCNFTYSFGKEIKKLLSITIEFAKMNNTAIIQGMIDKYGKASEVKTEVWQNKAGAKFDNTVTIWNHENGVIEAREIGSKLDFGEIVMISKEASKEMELKKLKDKSEPGF